jgi:hypothetical protein
MAITNEEIEAGAIEEAKKYWSKKSDNILINELKLSVTSKVKKGYDFEAMVSILTERIGSAEVENILNGK